MSQLKVDNITDEEGTGAPNFSNGLTGVVPASSITGALNATGSAPIFACRAWVNFNGTGTVAIRASGNVSSITDNATADYTINFATALEDANYTVTGLCGTGSASAATAIASVRLQDVITASAVRIKTTAGATANFADVHVAVFR